MPELTPRVVFDCNLFVQGIANRNSPARKALRLFFNGDISLFVSEPIIREVRDVLNRASCVANCRINDRIVNAFLTKLKAKAILLANNGRLPALSQPSSRRMPPGDDDWE